MSLSENELLTLKAENEKLKKDLYYAKENLKNLEFEQATRPAIQFMQQRGLAMDKIIIEWDRATWLSDRYSYAVPVVD